jgi:hypothetical protein
MCSYSINNIDLSLSLARITFNRRKYRLFWLCLLFPLCCVAQQTSVTGKVTDARTGRPLGQISVVFSGTHQGTSTDSLGRFSLKANGPFSQISFSGTGFNPLVKAVTPGTDNMVRVVLTASQTVLKEVAVTAGRNQRYRNKDNPAVELIRRVISHKDSNRMQSADYLQYHEYERIGLTFVDIPKLLVNNFLFRPYRFMLDTTGGKISAPVYLSEKQYQHYTRRTPEKSIRVLEAEKESNIIKFIDTTGLNTYLNRFYGDQIDLYDNNLLILNNEFLSPIADHAPEFYKFFIVDTIRSAAGTFVALAFVPRNKGDLLFEGRLLVTLDGHYAVSSCQMQTSGEINLNFVRKLELGLGFEKQPGGRYFLTRSAVKADFGILKNKGFGVTGERVLYYSGYVSNVALDKAFYRGSSERITPGSGKPDTAFWRNQRPDTLTGRQTTFYKKVARLEQMQSFRRATWIASTFSTGLADTGPFQFNLNDLAGYGQFDGLRLGVGGRTTPKFNRSVYVEGYLAEGTGDRRLKDQVSVYYTFNHVPFYRYPNNYLKLSQQYDISVPGGNFASGNFSTPLASFQSGVSRYYFYSKTYSANYVKEYESRFSLDIGLSTRDQQATGALQYTFNDAQHTVVDHITSTAVNLTLRYAPHEQLIQGADDRSLFESKYPVITLHASRGLKGVFNGSSDYTSFTVAVVKRFYLSQLGAADVTLLGNVINGKVPFPLLNISPANQSIVYDPNGYNQMHYLEFVSDHYAGINLTQSFNGFFLNKIPLIKHLKWREYLSFKALYGGLRAENNPYVTGGLYNFPAPEAGTTGTYALGDAPYTEAGVGIGNIFKLLRIDAIRRFNYLDHPGVSKYGFKLAMNINL